MKICVECGREFEPDEYHPHQRRCSKECNKHAYGRRQYERNKRYLQRVRAERGCKYPGCDIHDPRMLVFHHRDPTEKEHNLKSMKQRTRKKIDEEIAKCDVLCRNHHALVDWGEGNEDY